MDGFSLLQPEDKEEVKDCGEELEEAVCSICPPCTYQTRIYGCLGCFALGFVISLGSVVRLMTLLKGNPVPFATMYTSGNIVSLCATCFLYGPWSQAKRMFASTRFAATCIYFGFMATTLSLAFYPHDIPLRALLIVLSILCQFFALFWYTLSYIPYARDLTLSCLKGICPTYISKVFACQCLEDEEPESQGFGDRMSSWFSSNDAV